MSCKWFVCFLLSALSVGSKAGVILKEYNVEGYYWRDYDGTIPSDAVNGGLDNERTITYIGQIIHGSGNKIILHPGQVHPSYKNISYAYDGKPYTATKFIKILCSSQPEKFRWIYTNVEDMKFLLPQKHFVVAGYSGGYPLLVGRSSRGHQKIVGKVTIRQEYEGIGFVENSKPIYEKAYEVLSFDNG